MQANRTETKLEFVGTSGLNPFIANTSSPRACMDYSHVSQKLPLIKPDDPLVKTGIEYELAKYINDVRAEHDYTIKAIVPKYKEYGVEKPPVYTILAEYEENGQLYIDCIDVDTHRSNHGFFGYELHPTEEFNSLTYNSNIPKDTILAQTKSLGEDGEYRYGLNANMVFMSHPSVADDGFVVSESFCERAKFNSISKRIINITKETLPLNLFGTDQVFKFIPNIGEYVRPDGLLCGHRQRNDWFSISDMSSRNLRELDATFDTSVYVQPGSLVIDVSVIRGNSLKPEYSPKMTAQLDQYAEMLTNYYRNVVSKFEYLMNEKKAMYSNVEDVRLTPRMHRFITDSMIKITMATNGKNKLCYRKLPIDQYRIEVTTMSVIKPDLGYKLTTVHADKGVICAILPDDKMPVDTMGNRAEVITDSVSTISRMNLGRAYQSYLGAVSRDNRNKLINYYSNKYPNDFPFNIKGASLNYFKDYVTGLYQLINPEMLEFINSLNKEELKNHFVEVVTKQLNIYYPTDNAYNITDVIESIENSPYKPHNGKVSYIDTFNRQVTTKEDIRVGVLYFMMLEKIANDYSAVSSAKVNNFGFAVKGTNLDKFKYPHSVTPTKTLGETEERILTSFAPPEVIADLNDITLNPISHKLLIKHILEDTKGFDTQFDIDRATSPLGNTKSLGILKHMFNAAGFDYTYDEENQS